jgi:signal recognition particle subunit SRP54
MFESLTDRLNLTFKKLKGQGKLSEANMKEGLREVRLALLEADVHYKVAKEFIDRVRERSLGQEVLSSLTPAQQVIKIVQEELTELMGGARQDLNLAGRAPVAIMLSGLQGSGKTTTAGKLALYLKGKNFRPGLVPAARPIRASGPRGARLGAAGGRAERDDDRVSAGRASAHARQHVIAADAFAALHAPAQERGVHP